MDSATEWDGGRAQAWEKERGPGYGQALELGLERGWELGWGSVTAEEWGLGKVMELERERGPG